ncbi:GrpB family protein [Kitasatospora sp. NPDC089509]|uniref:GrpB family protein n=1 Tax=Kitasatospora sp. NPDC089509 TaxID=3364079 RepID=UPI003811A3F8
MPRSSSTTSTRTDRPVCWPRSASAAARSPGNRTEISGGQESRKLVVAPPAGGRRCNVHLGTGRGPNARFALPFRDYLRADEAARQTWGAFKKRLAVSAPGLLDYGQIAPNAWCRATSAVPPGPDGGQGVREHGLLVPQSGRPADGSLRLIRKGTLG